MASSSSPPSSSRINFSSYQNHRKSNTTSRRFHRVCVSRSEPEQDEKKHNQQPNQNEPVSRRELVMRSSEKPEYLGVQKNYLALALCPATKNCISTSADVSNLALYVPPWAYNPEGGTWRKKPVTREEAMEELLQVVIDSIIEYRSASRMGIMDFDVNRRRIKALRLALEKKG